MNQRGFTLAHLAVAIVILGLLAAIVVSVKSYIDGVDARGYARGVAEQKATDQKEFDRINKALAEQKAEANKLFAQKSAEVLALMQERAQLNQRLETQHAENQAATAALRDKYAGLGLRFRTAETPGCGDGGGSATGAQANAAGTARAAVVQLPDTIAGNLRRLAEDADRLRDDYSLCWAWAQEMR